MLQARVIKVDAQLARVRRLFAEPAIHVKSAPMEIAKTRSNNAMRTELVVAIPTTRDLVFTLVLGMRGFLAGVTATV